MKTLRNVFPGALALVIACVWGEATTARAATPAPPEIVILPEMTYPLALIHKGITYGEVHMLLKIGPDAQLIDKLVTSYTRKELADYTLYALEHARFQPLREDGRPITTIVAFTMRFESQGMIVIERHAVDRIDDLWAGLLAYEPCDPRRLDRPLQPISVVTPAYPSELGQQGTRGRVVLDYYVDETGRVRMPIVSETPHQILAGLSLAAIQQWQFHPPLSRNKPVLVHVRQAFEFVPEAKG